MDMFAYNLSNKILHNPDHTPVIEFHFPAPEIEFIDNCTFCLTGGNFDAHLNENPIRIREIITAIKGDILSFKKIISGFRGYLSVKGGLEAEEWLGSCSTNLVLGKGGFRGRILQRNDILCSTGNNHSTNEPPFEISENRIKSLYDTNEPVLCTKGPEWDLLEAESQLNISKGFFNIRTESNRMAYLLSLVSPLRIEERKEMLSSAVMQGTVQLLPDGRLALLMADHQTTGGFPRILQVLESQFPRLAQAAPGREISFKLTDHLSAREDYLSYMKLLRHGS